MFVRSDTCFQRFTCGFVGAFVGALIVGVWMGNPSQRQSWRAVLCAAVLAALGCGFGLPFYDAKKFTGSDFAVMLRDQMSFVLGVDVQRYRELIFVVMIAPVLYAFQCVVPVCLGTRLWSPVSMREARPSKLEVSGCGDPSRS